MSGPIATRAEFQQLAEVRLAEAKSLLDAGRWDGAYYLAGYAVEVALKARVIKWLLRTDAFPRRDFSRDCYTHKIGELIDLAGLSAAWRSAAKNDLYLLGNWGIASEWSEEKRYHRVSEAEARNLYAAIADAPHGVLSWIEQHW